MKSIFVLSMMLASALGCGGGGGLMLPGAGTGTGGQPASSPTCAKVQPCGGSVVGTWKLTSTCVGDGVVDASSICPAATGSIDMISGTGTVTYAADGTYQTMGRLALDVTLTIPTACFGPGETCATLGAMLAQQAQIPAASCTTSGASCACRISTVQGAETGTWQTSGTTLTLTPMGGDVSNDDYCVQGNELHDIALDTTMPLGAMGAMRIAGDLVYTKQ
jgi:hypothetical protein